MLEKEIQAAIVARARALGLFVLVTASDKGKRQQEVGLPDLLIWGKNRFLTLEVKAEDGELRPSQIEFFDQLAGRQGENVIHRVVYSMPQALVWLEWLAGKGIWGGANDE